MNLLAFWALRGYTPAQLASLSAAEKAFLEGARDLYYEEISAMLGGGKA